jgi:hypothetical protein
MVYWGYKVNGNWGSQYFPIGTQLPVSVIVDNLPLARELANRGKFVIHRFVNLNGVKDEGISQWHYDMGADKYATALANAHGHNNKDIWIYVFNEPNRGNVSDQQVMLDFAVAVGQRLIDMGFKIVLLNTPPASWREDWLAQGTADNLLRFASNNRDRVIIGYHDYSDISMVLYGNGEKDYSKLSDPNYVRKDNWAKSINPDTAWHVGHVTRLVRRARQLGLTIRLGCTEFNYINLFDPPNEPHKRQLGQQFPPSPVRSVLDLNVHDGQHTLHGYWRAMYPQWTWEQVVMEQIKWYASVMATWGLEFVTFYAFGFSAEHGADYWNDNEFHRQLIEWQKPVTPPPPVGRDVMIKPAGNYGVNVREQPSVSSSRIGAIFAGQSVAVKYYETTPTGWHKILFGGGIAYVSAQHTTIIEASRPVTVTATYTYNANDMNEVRIHNQIQGLINSLR